MVVVVEVKNGEAFGKIQNIIDQFPVAVENAGKDFGKSVVRRLKREVTSQGLRWRGRLHGGIEFDEDSMEVKMPIYGVYLDSMRPHWVKLKRGRLIREWAYAKGNYFVRAAATAQRSIFVRPHPFIQGPTERAIRDLPNMIRNRTSRCVNSRGKST